MRTDQGNQGTILIVDDEPTNIRVLMDHLSRAGYRVLVAEDGESALEQARHACPDLIVLDVLMPGVDGFETCKILKADDTTADIPVIFMTVISGCREKVRAFAVGGADYVTKPFQQEEVLARVRTHVALSRLRGELQLANQSLEARIDERTRELSDTNASLEAEIRQRGKTQLALEQALAEIQSLKNQLQAENRYLQEEIREAHDHHEIIGTSRALENILQQVRIVAPTDTSVLISGETGTGKELIARAVHDLSRRRDRPLVKLNCAAISAGLVESELFGHVKGAFTGAFDRRVGRFELADQGTLFLDEVSELPLETQAKLLRVLQEKEFEPVGSSRSVHVDVRIVAATNRKLETAVEQGRFRADLFYRLNVFPIEIPPLRQRRDDIEDLVQCFVSRSARRIGKRIGAVAPETMHKLRSHEWPGNVRDLQNVIERAVILCKGDMLTVPWELAQCGAPRVASSPEVDDRANETQASSLEDVERAHIIAILRKTHGVVEGTYGAARILNLKPSTARYRIKKLGIHRADFSA